MAGNYSYDHLPTLEESQDIAEYIDTAWRASSSDNAHDSQTTLRHPSSSSSLQSYSAVEQRDAADRASLNSFGTYASSSSSGTSIEKLKNGFKSGISRIRRKPLPRYMQGSIRRHPAAEIEPTRIGRGVWKDQLLVDRSLRSMALLMSLFAIAMIIVICVNIKAFAQRNNKFTSSIGGETQDCKTVTHTNTALLFLINIAATMVLGCSNTYQQLVTSLKISDLRHVLEKFGDSRVGTNSPFNINHKSEGKKTSWAAWLLLIFSELFLKRDTSSPANDTPASLPIHFLGIPNHSASTSNADFRYSKLSHWALVYSGAAKESGIQRNIF